MSADLEPPQPPCGDELDFQPFQIALQDSFIEFFSNNRVAVGRRDYYGVEVSNIRLGQEAIHFDLTLTFKKGERYCCLEDGCHHWLFGKDSWTRLRDVLKRKGYPQRPPFTLGILHGRVDAGALANYGGMLKGEQEVVEESYEYTAGPYVEAKAT